jgi:transketolase
MDCTEIEKISRQIRKDILTMVSTAGSGHPGGSLSAVELLVVLYFAGFMRIAPEDEKNPRRDRFVLSKGHCAPVLYSILCRKGFFPEKHLLTLRRLGSILQGHPHAPLVPGMDFSSGSLGQGLSIANGLAMGCRRQGFDNRVYCLLGDGELQEGQVWEAAMSAAQHKLNNVCAIVDNNHVQLDGMTADIKCVEPVADKWRAFGWNVLEIAGHDLNAIYSAYQSAMKEPSRPTVIVAETIKGKGVSFMENNAAWHGTAPNQEQLAAALQEINGGIPA